MKLLLIFAFMAQVSIAVSAPPLNRSPEEQMAVNGRIFTALSKGGAVEGQEYDFDQILSGDSEATLKAVLKDLEALGFKASSVERRQGNDGTVYYVDAYQRMQFSKSRLSEFSLAVLNIAMAHKVYYDGWGTEIK